MMESQLNQNKKPLLSSWDDIQQLYKSYYFSANASDMQEDTYRSRPGERLLFTQSNARALLGQNSKGQLAFLALPTNIYPVPTESAGIAPDFDYGPGMYYQSNMIVSSGALSYEIMPEGSDTVIEAVSDDSCNESYYAGHFLPLTRALWGDLEITITSFAPVSLDERQAPLSPAPLPGPSGVFYIMRVKNNGSAPFKGKVRLNVCDLLSGIYNFEYPFIKSPTPSTRSFLRDVLILSKPEGCMGIHLNHGRWTDAADKLYAERTMDISPGGELIIEAQIVLCKDFMNVMPEIFQLGLHNSLQWLDATASFWYSRLGCLDVDAFDAGKTAKISKDVYIRCILDNFNCIQTDGNGNVIAHWQGAPSHICGTTWGIDVEPTAISIMQVCPELARQILLFFMDKSRAPRSGFDKSEHSVPILVAPVIIARKYLELTGDLPFFKDNPHVMDAMEGIIQDLLRLKHTNFSLFPSRYSSDGNAFRRYDHGVNVKAWYTLDSYAYLLTHVKPGSEAGYYLELRNEVARAIKEKMTMEGPFGLQLSGGTNLGEEHGSFYLAEGIPYYDGEESANALAPIYGIYSFQEELWINYHRFARSLWCNNFDPEFEVRRWFQYGGPLDGTAYVARLGGSVTRDELIEAADILHMGACDKPSGSFYWWPSGINKKRCLTRCSQGQGAWEWQYLQQWLGIKADACTRTIDIVPQGLLTKFDWKGAVIGSCRFDISWEESPQECIVKITNHNPDSWHVRAGFRPFNTGAEETPEYKMAEITCGENIVLKHTGATTQNSAIPVKEMITRAESRAFGDKEGIVFDYYGSMPLTNITVDTDTTNKDLDVAVLIRFIIINGTGVNWQKATVELSDSLGWDIHKKVTKRWDLPADCKSAAPVSELGAFKDGDRAVVSFWVTTPFSYNAIDLAGIQYTRNPFNLFNGSKEQQKALLVPTTDINNASFNQVLTAKLIAFGEDGREFIRSIKIPIQPKGLL